MGNHYTVDYTVMKKREPGITPAIIEAMKSQGYNQTDIAEMTGYTRSYVSWVKHNKSGRFSQTSRETVMEHFPWTPGARFHGAQPGRRMRDHAEYMATLGKGMSAYKLKRLQRFYDRLDKDNLVLEFHPGIPPSKGIATGGFAFRKRESSDGLLIIRDNDVTEITDYGRLLWRMPKEQPRVRFPDLFE